MASVPKIVPAVVTKPVAKPVSKTASPVSVTGGRLATGARNVASVGGPAVEEISAKAGLSRDDSSILFQDYARPPDHKFEDPVLGSQAMQGVGFGVGAAFQVQESEETAADGAPAPGRGATPQRFAIAVESYRTVQDAADEPELQRGGSLSLNL